MVRRGRLVFSHQHLNIEQVDRRRRDTEAAVQAYFALDNPKSAQRFFGFTPSEVRAEKEALLEEARRAASMDVFGALEAAFRIDFLQRCYRRERDAVSRALRRLYGEKGARASLEGDVFAAWRRHSDVPRRLVDNLTKAFKYRHWLAHGRYWSPRFPRLDYDEVYTLAKAALDAFPFKESRLR